LTEDEVNKWVSQLIADDRLHEFYVSKEWRKLRKEVLEEAKHGGMTPECQICKANGFYSEANHVHHIQYVRRHPRYALSRTYTYQGKERVNLIAVCKDCHETVCHPERMRKKKDVKPLTVERW
jgi:formate-dependent nitrite reductase cytochrome c552 subunit